MPLEQMAVMGTKGRVFAPLPPVTLEDLVPPDHFYRHLERTLDLSFVRDLVRDVYAESGRPSIDPVVFFKLQLVLFFEGLRSERQLLRVVADRLSLRWYLGYDLSEALPDHSSLTRIRERYGLDGFRRFFEGLRSERQLLRVVADRLSLRWYLGYDLSEALPDHSSLTRIRERYGLEVFRRFFEAIVAQCIATGLVWGEELYIDATKVAANADLDSLQPRFAVEAHLAQLFAAEGGDGNGGDGSGGATGESEGDAPARLPVDLPDAAQAELAECAAIRHDWMGNAGRPNRRERSAGYRRTADFRVSTTDPDATPMPPGDGRTRLGYQDHYVVDGGQARIILTALVTPAEVQENQPALDLLWWTRFRWKLRPRQITADTKYGTVANIVAIEDQGIRAYVPLSEAGQRPGVFGEQDFVYDAAADTYRCPGAETLHFLSQCQTTRRRIYAAPARSCGTCVLQAPCTTSPRGRRVSRSLDVAYLDRVRGYHATEPYAKAMRKRQVWVEPLFAEAKDWHGLRRFRLRGLEKVNIEALLVAAGQNLKRLLSRWGWGRRPFPSGAAGVVLPTLQPTAAVAH